MDKNRDYIWFEYDHDKGGVRFEEVKSLFFIERIYLSGYMLCVCVYMRICRLYKNQVRQGLSMMALRRKNRKKSRPFIGLFQVKYDKMNQSFSNWLLFILAWRLVLSFLYNMFVWYILAVFCCLFFSFHHYIYCSPLLVDHRDVGNFMPNLSMAPPRMYTSWWIHTPNWFTCFFVPCLFFFFVFFLVFEKHSRFIVYFFLLGLIFT